MRESPAVSMRVGSYANTASCSKDVKTRIAMAKRKMVQLNTIWKDCGTTTDLKIKILSAFIWPVLCYGGEDWTLRKHNNNNNNNV